MNIMERAECIDTVVVDGGHADLCMSYVLQRKGASMWF